MTWFVQLNGDSSDLAALAASLTGPEVSVSHDGETYVLSATTFDPSDEPNNVRREAEEILGALNGAARLALDVTQAIRAGNAYRRLPNGAREHFLFADAGLIRFRGAAATVSVVKADGSVQTIRPADPIREWMSLAGTSDAVSKVLRIIGKGALDWVNLYRIFEIIGADVGGLDKMASEGWATKTSMRLFKHTANSPGALGLDSRHRAESNQPPPKPMEVAEARSLILTIVHAWLRTKQLTP